MNEDMNEEQISRAAAMDSEHLRPGKGQAP